MCRNVVGAVIAVLGIAGASCSQLQSPAGPTLPGTAPSASTTGSTANFAGELTLCVEQTNRYRASAGRAPLVRSQALEDFAARAAEHDTLARVAHQHFALTNGAGVARAETEILWWKGVAVRAVVERGLSQMWQVGPGGEHYDIMSGDYTEIGCGIFVTGGEVTVAQDFR